MKPAARIRNSHAPRARHAVGFTIVELVTVMILVGILALAALPRMNFTQAFDARGFHDQAMAAVQFARKTAVAQRRNVCVTLSGSTLSVTRAQAPGAAAACTALVIDPGTGGALALTAPGGVSIAGPASVVFDALGRYNANASASWTLTGDIARTITVERETGYVH